MNIILSSLLSLFLTGGIITGSAVDYLPKVNQSLSYLGTTTKSVKEDPPLIITRTISAAEFKNRKVLYPSEILSETNKERLKMGLTPLKWNEKLAKMAEHKGKDMADKNYFAHISPSGIDVSKLAQTYKYDYSLVGENLAMGDFLSSEDVVEGWMQSPGHRANILKPTYTEIGISAVPKFSNGKLTWYSVQEFGRPSPVCPKPNSKTEEIIKNGNAALDKLNKTLDSLNLQITSEDDIAKKNQLISSYNKSVVLGNKLHDNIKATVNNYNKEISAYNECIKRDQEIVKAK